MNIINFSRTNARVRQKETQRYVAFCFINLILLSLNIRFCIKVGASYAIAFTLIIYHSLY